MNLLILLFVLNTIISEIKCGSLLLTGDALKKHVTEDDIIYILFFDSSSV